MTPILNEKSNTVTDTLLGGLFVVGAKTFSGQFDLELETPLGRAEFAVDKDEKHYGILFELYYPEGDADCLDTAAAVDAILTDEVKEIVVELFETAVREAAKNLHKK